MNVVVMGVAGCGKTTVGKLLAAQIGGVFYDGDDFHPPANIAKLSRGEPLTDADRLPWLDALAALLKKSSAAAPAGIPPPLILACSALRRTYRDRLRAGDPALKFVWLNGPRSLLETRLRERQGHFMGVKMLDSQLATLEPPDAEENILALDVALSPETQAVAAQKWLAI